MPTKDVACKFCASTRPLYEERCYLHCQEAEDGKHVADPTTIVPSDGIEFGEVWSVELNGSWIVDVWCKNCGQSGSAPIDPTDVQWE